MKRSALAILVLFFAVGSAAVSQSLAKVSDMPYSGAPCTGSGGIGPSAQQVAAFTRFDAELRSALEKNDPAALAFLIGFPLRVNTSKGQLLIPDAESLAGHYSEIFTPGVRSEVLATVTDDYICRYDEGLGYKRGIIWVSTDGHRFTLGTVNLRDQQAESKEPALIFACETKTHRIAIDELEGGGFRYRSWNKPKSLSTAPDLDLAQGKQEYEGSGVCAHSVYTFTSGQAVYQVEGGLGCTDGSEPSKATGHLSVTIGGKQVTDDWCF
jgi:hypothetical protein